MDAGAHSGSSTLKSMLQWHQISPNFMPDTLTKKVDWRHSKEPAGRISVNLRTGAVAFLDGAPELEEYVLVSLAHGVYRPGTVYLDENTVAQVSRKVEADHPDFEIYLSSALGLSGFRLAR